MTTRSASSLWTSSSRAGGLQAIFGLGFARLWMSISGSMMGTRPAARIWRATVNCCPTTSSSPAPGSVMNERILGAKDAVAEGPSQQLVEVLDWLHELGTIGLVGEPVVHLRKGTSPLSD